MDYIDRKENEYWIAYALDRRTRQVIDFVIGKRSRTDGTTTQSLTLSGPVKLGVIPNAEVGLGLSTDSKGVTTFSFGLSGSGKIGKSTYGGGIETSVSGSNTKGSGSAAFSGYTEKTSGDDKNKYSLKIQF